RRGIWRGARGRRSACKKRAAEDGPQPAKRSKTFEGLRGCKGGGFAEDLRAAADAVPDFVPVLSSPCPGGRVVASVRKVTLSSDKTAQPRCAWWQLQHGSPPVGPVESGAVDLSRLDDDVVAVALTAEVAGAGKEKVTEWVEGGAQTAGKAPPWVAALASGGEGGELVRLRRAEGLAAGSAWLVAVVARAPEGSGWSAQGIDEVYPAERLRALLQLRCKEIVAAPPPAEGRIWARRVYCPAAVPRARRDEYVYGLVVLSLPGAARGKIEMLMAFAVSRLLYCVETLFFPGLRDSNPYLASVLYKLTAHMPEEEADDDLLVTGSTGVPWPEADAEDVSGQLVPVDEDVTGELGHTDIFLLTLTSAGELGPWQKQLRSPGDQRPTAAAGEAAGGHVYVAGVSSGSGLSPELGAPPLTAFGGEDALLMKLIWGRAAAQCFRGSPCEVGIPEGLGLSPGDGAVLAAARCGLNASILAARTGWRWDAAPGRYPGIQHWVGDPEHTC
ncbi:unnamed protein product, partial [Prorocentrum cordatum]